VYDAGLDGVEFYESGGNVASPMSYIPGAQERNLSRGTLLGTITGMNTATSVDPERVLADVAPKNTGECSAAYCPVVPLKPVNPIKPVISAMGDTDFIALGLASALGAAGAGYAFLADSPNAMLSGVLAVGAALSFFWAWHADEKYNTKGHRERLYIVRILAGAAALAAAVGLLYVCCMPGSYSGLSLRPGASLLDSGVYADTDAVY